MLSQRTYHKMFLVILAKGKVINTLMTLIESEVGVAKYRSDCFWSLGYNVQLFVSF